MSMYGKGLSTRDMQDIINDIYGVDLSPETIARIIDRIQPRIELRLIEKMGQTGRQLG
jgi:putative transposase